MNLISSISTEVSNVLLDMIAPVRCSHCEMGNLPLCARCRNQIDYIIFPQIGPPSLDSLTCLARFSGVIQEYIHLMKFGPNRPCAFYAGHLLYWHTHWPTTECVTSIPLSKWRRWDRGFNQAELMARSFSQLSEIPYVPLLRRHKHAKPQAEIHSRNERLKRLTGQYSMQKSGEVPASVLLIDDVCTSGATLEEGAQVLKNAGVKQVHGLTLAREL